MSDVTVADVLAELEGVSPGLAELLAGTPDRPVRAIWLAEDLREVGESPRHALVVLGRAASREAEGYRLDVTLRRLPEVAGLMLQSAAPRPSLSALALARREDLPLLRLTAPFDVTRLLTVVTRMLDAELPTLLARTVRMCEDVDRLAAAGVEDEELLRPARELFGVTLGPRQPRLAGVPAVVTDADGPWLQREERAGAEDALARLAMWRLCGAFTRRAVEAERAEHLTMMSAGEIVTLLLGAPAEELAPLARRAAAGGVRVEGWNQVVALEFANLSAVADGDPVTAYHYGQTLRLVAARAAAHQEGSWTMAARPSGALLLRSRGHADTPAELRRLRAGLQAVLDRVLEPYAGVQVLCGVGGAHEGVEGLRASAAEAESALQSARLRGAYGVPVLFDAPGLSRLLVEWYSSSSVRQSIDGLLAPLASLDAERAREYLETLRAYLENNRSVTRTAQQLYVHRNTIAYRLEKILRLLDIDLDDPNQYLALYLACYAQAMTHAAPARTR